jgi:hypothetical protein
MALHETKTTLVRLSDTELTVADRADDIRGRDVLEDISKPTGWSIITP